MTPWSSRWSSWPRTCSRRSRCEPRNVNLEFDADTEDLIERAATAFRRAAPIERLRTVADRRTSWRALHDAGWASLGADLVRGELDQSAAVGIYREAGRQLLGEELVTAGYLLPALIAHVDGPSDELRTPLRPRPGHPPRRGPRRVVHDRTVRPRLLLRRRRSIERRLPAEPRLRTGSFSWSSSPAVRRPARRSPDCRHRPER